MTQGATRASPVVHGWRERCSCQQRVQPGRDALNVGEQRAREDDTVSSTVGMGEHLCVRHIGVEHLAQADGLGRHLDISWAIGDVRADLVLDGNDARRTDLDRVAYTVQAQACAPHTGTPVMIAGPDATRGGSVGVWTFS
jgi:hypothetical protein